jgi:hypothetical protein
VSKAFALEDRLVAAASSAAAAAEGRRTPPPAAAAAAAAAAEDETPAADLADILREQLRCMDELVRERASASAVARGAHPADAPQPLEQGGLWGGLCAHGPSPEGGRDAGSGRLELPGWAPPQPVPSSQPYWQPPAPDSADDAACGRRVTAQPTNPGLGSTTAHSGWQALPATAAAYSDFLGHSGDGIRADAPAARTSGGSDTDAEPRAPRSRDGRVEPKRGLGAGSGEAEGGSPAEWVEDAAAAVGPGDQDAMDAGADSDSDADSDVDPVLQRARQLLRALGQMGA